MSSSFFPLFNISRSKIIRDDIFTVSAINNYMQNGYANLNTKLPLKPIFMGKIKLQSRRVYIKNFNKENQDILVLYGIYKEIIDPTLDYEKFMKLYYSEKLVAIDFTLFSSQNERAGFSAAFFYSVVVNGKPSFTARAATGLKKLSGVWVFTTNLTFT